MKDQLKEKYEISDLLKNYHGNTSLKSVTDCAEVRTYRFNGGAEISLVPNDSGIIAVHLDSGLVKAVNQVDLHSQRPTELSMYSNSIYDQSCPPSEKQLEIILANEALRQNPGFIVRNQGSKMLVFEGQEVPSGEKGSELVGQVLTHVPEGYELVPFSIGYGFLIGSEPVIALRPREDFAKKIKKEEERPYELLKLIEPIKKEAYFEKIKEYKQGKLVLPKDFFDQQHFRK